LGEVSRGRSSEEAWETRQSKGLKNQKTDHFEHLRKTADSILKRANVATAAAIRSGDYVGLVDSNRKRGSGIRVGIRAEEEIEGAE
jgi:transposase-like protein